MKKIAFFLLIFIFIFSASFLIAKEDEEKVPAGMEIIEVGGVRVLTIKGTKVREKDGLLEIEGTKEYVARKFIEVENRFKELEERINKLEKEIEQLNGGI